MTANRWRLVLGFIACLLVPVPTHAQDRRPVPRVALLCTTGCNPMGGGPWSRGFSFTDEMKALGYHDGNNIVIDTRGAGVTERSVERVVEDLVRQKTNVIVAIGTASVVAAAKRVTARIPIVMAISEDAVDTGLVASLAKPGGNITGASTPYRELIVKQLQLLREVVPGATRVGVLAMQDNGSHESAIRSLRTAAQHHGVAVHVERASPAHHDLGASLSRLREARVEALVILPHPLLLGGGQVAMFALQGRIPTVSTFSEYVSAAGLMAYGPNASDLQVRAARYVDRILKGARTADLPVEQPTVFHLALNTATAKALGLTIPPSLLLRADQVIE